MKTQTRIAFSEDKEFVFIEGFGTFRKVNVEIQGESIKIPKIKLPQEQGNQKVSEGILKVLARSPFSAQKNCEIIVSEEIISILEKESNFPFIPGRTKIFGSLVRVDETLGKNEIIIGEKTEIVI